MKSPLKKVLITALATISAFVSITYMSCNSDKCKTIVCAYGGVCNQGACICPSGYEGTNCETISSNKFIANWQVFEKGSGTNASQYGISIQQDAPITNVTITNFYNYFTVPVKAYITNDTITIPNQELQGKVIFGVGFIYSPNTYSQYGAISMRYEVVDTATGFVNDFGYYPADLSNASAWNK